MANAKGLSNNDVSVNGDWGRGLVNFNIFLHEVREILTFSNSKIVEYN